MPRSTVDCGLFVAFDSIKMSRPKMNSNHEFLGSFYHLFWFEPIMDFVLAPQLNFYKTLDNDY